MPGWFAAGDQPYQIWMTHTPSGEIVANSMGASPEASQLVSYSGDSISMYTHCGTQKAEYTPLRPEPENPWVR
jgi:hypothetical protein